MIHVKPGKAQIHIIDNLDPAALNELLSQVESLEKTLVIGISKSGTTRETQDILKALSQRFESEGLNPQNHFLWLTDLTQGRKSIEGIGIQTLPIQLNGETDIGGRFTAPHTAIFLIPLYLAINRDLKQLNTIWCEYLRLREAFLEWAANKAHYLAEKETRRFAILLDEQIVKALETWATQLIQESLGSKIANYNPKTIVLPKGEAIPQGFEQINFDFDSSDLDVEIMVDMHLLEVFTAIFAYEKGMNFVNQPDVELYKREMNLLDLQKLPKIQPASFSELVAKIRNCLHTMPETRFLEVICYWHLKNNSKELLRKRLKNGFPELETLVFAGSDWNHHSYQAASRSEDTLFIILTKSNYEHCIKGVSEFSLMNNINTIQKIAFATQQTLRDRAILLVVDEARFISEDPA